MFLPWFADGQGTHAGIGENDGVVVLIVLFGAAVLVALGNRAAWVAAGFAAMVAIRNLLTINDHPVAEARVGIWLTIGASVIAALVLLREMVVAVTNRPH